MRFYFLDLLGSFRFCLGGISLQKDFHFRSSDLLLQNVLIKNTNKQTKNITHTHTYRRRKKKKKKRRKKPEFNTNLTMLRVSQSIIFAMLCKMET